MLAPQVHGLNTVKATNTLLASPIHSIANHQFPSSSTCARRIRSPPSTLYHRRSNGGLHVVRCMSLPFFGKDKDTTKVKAIVTVKVMVKQNLDVGIQRGFDHVTDFFGKGLFLELVSTELDPNTGADKKPIGSFAHKKHEDKEKVIYEADFNVKQAFGPVGATLVENQHNKEMYIANITLSYDGSEKVTLLCNSWVHSKNVNKEKRVFFLNKAFLPSKTPKGLETLRKKELELLRGNGEGERKMHERIYDYDVYNDLGCPDITSALARPVIGGQARPYPRRCRTGRPKAKNDPNSETRAMIFTWYVPRDENFSEMKGANFAGNLGNALLGFVFPTIAAVVKDPCLEFPYFTAIDSLFKEGLKVPKESQSGLGLYSSLLPRLLKGVANEAEGVVRFEMPELMERDKFSWFRDEEFARQTLAGLNPLGIELVTEFPFVSKLDPSIYGPVESAITKEIIEREINGVMTVEEAVKQKKLFILDYHDLLLPYVHKVRELGNTTLYGSRTLLFLQPDDTLKMIAIELTRPASPSKPQWKKVFTPTTDATGAWLWKFAKIHVCGHDAGIHQLISHWLRTHCCMEPYIIAANRQLSVMHPIYRLLHPHFRYTMEINVLARQLLINAGAIIEQAFSPGKYSVELSSVFYDKLWQFDTEALPADLIKRGMAVEDPNEEHGLKLTIKDYPYANDGLLLWSAQKQWVTDYVSHYYPDDNSVASDNELQAWWTEVRTKGHADKKDAPWWPRLNTTADLIHIVTTIMWVASGHHAAVNFGQYHYAGYFPNRPTIARTNVPVEDASEKEFAEFIKKPEAALMKCFPSQMQAMTVTATLDLLSGHSVEEEYIGALDGKQLPQDPAISAAYERFNGRLKEIEKIVDDRNKDFNLRNRTGAGLVPYELLKPFSEPGVTGKGVPNSISI